MESADTVKALMQEGKGILLAGESNEIESERLSAFGVGEEGARRAYRELLFTTPGIEGHLSGVVLSPEAVQEKSADGIPFPDLLKAKQIVPGVSVSIDAAGDEKFIDSLREYKSQGVLFAFFSFTVPFSSDPVSDELQKNILALAACAKASQTEGMVPVIALDVSMYGTHSSAEAEDHILDLLSLLSDALRTSSVEMPLSIIAVSMAVSGSDTSARSDAAEVAERSVRALTTALSEKVGGVVFLSDAQNPEEATANLNALARLEPLPWPIAFCFSRALQEPVLAAWKGNTENFAEAQSVFEERLSLLSRADAAGYSKTYEQR